jgi:hypothetical protein
LDAKELITSKRFVNAKVNSNFDINFSIDRLQDIVKDDKKATQIMEDILKDEGILDGKIPINKDFLSYLALDTNRDTVISDKEMFNDMQARPLSAIFKKSILE